MLSESRVTWLLVGLSPSAAVGTQGNVTEEDGNSLLLYANFLLPLFSYLSDI